MYNIDCIHTIWEPEASDYNLHYGGGQFFCLQIIHNAQETFRLYVYSGGLNKKKIDCTTNLGGLLLKRRSLTSMTAYSS